MADEEDDDSKEEAKKSDPPAPSDEASAKPVSKSMEWGIAIAMMVVLIGVLFMMIHLMRSARSAVM
jgi:hypothetical protein